ncbi:hypothetical protein BCR37DRAFT_389158 [Protomyces lactucae-debilis]|uniref:Uncharacterized protein n=1 Tax=Protomyces lactucae-debilis TaxID=2754530 RepID=A0A1Y2F1H4_PROLT|nr:uncharacterized protein BCR37DRAFT_389158 [Protomyces lactucae-debilis]ORY77344.1 hypothetical protein BCR37DRAFT_389158 [Protomyces lactucae-debilis]
MPRLEADHFLIARPPTSKGPTAPICQLQRLGPAACGTRIHTPAYDLRRASHVLDPQEAIVTSYEDERLAVFKSPKSKLARRVSQATTRRSKSASPSTTPQRTPLSVHNLNALTHVCSTDTRPSGTLRVHYKPDAPGRDWQIDQSSAGFTFWTQFSGVTNTNFQLVWTHRYKPQRKTSASSVISRRASRSNSPAQGSTTSLSAGLGKRRLSLPGLVLQPADEWTCRIVDPDKVATVGESRGVKVAKLTVDELILYHLPSRTSTDQPSQSTETFSSPLSLIAEQPQPERISRTVIMSALWILTHPHDLFLMHGLGQAPDWLHRPRGTSLTASTLPRSRSPLRRTQGVTTPGTSVRSGSSAPASRDASPSPAPTTERAHSQSLHRGRTISTEEPRGRSKSSISSSTIPGRATTTRPTCYSFLNSFKLWKPRSQRQR